MRQRYLDRITFTASSISTIDLPREHWAKKITLLLDGVCSSGSAVSRSSYNPFDIITRIEVIANGSQTIKSYSGKMLFLQNILEHGTVPSRTQTPASTSQTSQSFGGALTMYFDKDKDYIESLLPTRVLSSLQLKITWATAATIDSGSGFSIASLYIYPLLTEEINRGQSTANVGVLKETEFVKTLTAAGWAELELPVLTIAAKDAAAAYTTTKAYIENPNLDQPKAAASSSGISPYIWLALAGGAAILIL